MTPVIEIIIEVVTPESQLLVVEAVLCVMSG